MLLAINALAVLTTFLGGLTPMLQLSRAGMWRIFALRSGILLSITFTEIFPAAFQSHPTLAGWGALGSFVLFFYVGSLYMVDTCPEYLEECPVHLLGWAAMAALWIHSFVDGFNVSVSFSAGSTAGSAVGLALILHKLADGFTLTSLLRQAGYTPAQIHLGLIAIAFSTPLGSLVSYWGLGGLGPNAAAILLGFAAGSFLYVAAADILPRLHKNGDRVSLAYFAAGMAGIAVLHFIAE